MLVQWQILNLQFLQFDLHEKIDKLFDNTLPHRENFLVGIGLPIPHHFVQHGHVVVLDLHLKQARHLPFILCPQPLLKQGIELDSRESPSLTLRKDFQFIFVGVLDFLGLEYSVDVLWFQCVQVRLEFLKSIVQEHVHLYDFNFGKLVVTQETDVEICNSPVGVKYVFFFLLNFYKKFHYSASHYVTLNALELVA